MLPTSVLCVTMIGFGMLVVLNGLTVIATLFRAWGPDRIGQSSTWPVQPLSYMHSKVKSFVASRMKSGKKQRGTTINANDDDSFYGDDEGYAGDNNSIIDEETPLVGSSQKRTSSSSQDVNIDSLSVFDRHHLLHYYPLYVAYTCLMVSLLFFGFWLSMNYDLYNWIRSDGQYIELNTPLAIAVTYPMYMCLLLVITGSFLYNGNIIQIVTIGGEAALVGLAVIWSLWGVYSAQYIGYAFALFFHVTVGVHGSFLINDRRILSYYEMPGGNGKYRTRSILSLLYATFVAMWSYYTLKLVLLAMSPGFANIITGEANNQLGQSITDVIFNFALTVMLHFLFARIEQMKESRVRIALIEVVSPEKKNSGGNKSNVAMPINLPIRM
jgi:hypothetical protein